MVKLLSNRSAEHRLGKSEAGPRNEPSRRSALRSRARERGALMAEMVVAMALLIFALMPLAYSFTKEQRYLRSCYQRAVAMEFVDGEMEVLLAGEWRAFKDGVQPYQPHGLALTNLPPGKFELTVAGPKLRLEWSPAVKDHGGAVVREAAVK
ncbi:MAG: hypothetical protein EXS35_18630 [Pedosphaera sp.]|nr:hypothetical protein [Pedosphaera sp.]